MNKKVLIDKKQIHITIERLCRQLIENHDDFSGTVLLGLQPRGIFLAERIRMKLSEILEREIPLGILDATFYRDDFRRKEKPLIANATHVPFIIENKKVVLIDDVLYTGRTVRASLDAMIAFGRPAMVELLALVNRKYSRDLPIQANYIGIDVSCLETEKIVVELTEEEGINSDLIALVNVD